MTTEADMDKFRLSINVEPKDIPALDDAHKRDCADAINGVINRTFKYTMILAFSVMAFYGVYTIFGMPYLLRMGRMLPQMSAFVPVIAVVIAVIEVFSGIMKPWAIVIEMLLQAGLIVASALRIPSLIIIPFAVYGIYLHLRQFSMLPFYRVISELKGYPDFTPLPIGEVVKKTEVPEKTEENETAEISESAGKEKADSEQ